MTIFGAFILLFVFFIFSPWFSISDTLSAGDWPYLYLENIKEFSFPPQASPLWVVPYYQITAKVFVEFLGLHWHLVERIFWFWPFLLISIFSSYYFTRSWIGVLIYLTNTYVLMVAGGGQMGVALAYALVPFVLKSFFNIIDNTFLNTQNFKFHPFDKFRTRISNFKLPVLAGLALALELMFDPRLAYITVIVVMAYYLFLFVNSKRKFKTVLLPVVLVFFTTLIIAIFLNLFWIIPFALSGRSIGENYTSLAGFKFFSFSDFSHAFSLLHPNWPENIFGKTYFLNPIFLLLPILAYSSLFFLKDTGKNTKILYFAFLGLIGAFLSKGSQEPFGFINEFIFNYVPGMSLFRDSTKFFLLIVLSYSFLIDNALLNIGRKFKHGEIIMPFLFVFLWCFLSFPALKSQLTGTFQLHTIPKEYTDLKNLLLSESESKTFWLPEKQRFGFSSKKHLAVSTQELLGVSSASSVSAVLNEDMLLKKIKKEKIQYIILPLDTHKELFILDRKYNEKIRDELEQKLSNIQGFKRLSRFKEISVYMVQLN